MALEKGLISQSTVSERKQDLMQKNPNLPDEEAEYIVAMQIFSSVNGQIMFDVLPSLMDGTYKTDDVELLTAMNKYLEVTDNLDDVENSYELQTEAALELYKEYLNYLVRLYEN